MKVLNVEQLQALDKYTIENEPVPSIDLMERAAGACCEWIIEHFAGDASFLVFAGPGNNGGDGLAIVRMLHRAGRTVSVVHDASAGGSSDFNTNLERLRGLDRVKILDFKTYDWSLPDDAILIDAIFGYGLNRPAEGSWRERIEAINRLPNLVISIDLPSGLFADKPTTGIAVQAAFTLTFQTPKLAFFAPENEEYVGEWIVLDIGLDQSELNRLETPYRTIEPIEISRLIHSRKKFDHKGIYGHALLVAGSFGKVGAAILAARAALRSGVGLLTIHAPRQACDILQVTVPEAMVSSDRHDYNFSGVDNMPSKVTAIGMGCGLGLHGCTTEGIRDLLKRIDFPVVIDADGLNTLGRNPELMQLIPKKSILTPHMKEFERLFAGTEDHFERLERLRNRAQQLELIGVLKGAHTAVALPDGTIWFNTTGNPGMATGGSGDVLTGIITGLLAQNYTPEDAARIGVFVHGLAGDIAREHESDESMVASDIIDNLGRAFQYLHEL